MGMYIKNTSFSINTKEVNTGSSQFIADMIHFFVTTAHLNIVNEKGTVTFFDLYNQDIWQT